MDQNSRSDVIDRKFKRVLGLDEICPFFMLLQHYVAVWGSNIIINGLSLQAVAWLRTFTRQMSRQRRRARLEHTSVFVVVCIHLSNGGNWTTDVETRTVKDCVCWV